MQAGRDKGARPGTLGEGDERKRRAMRDLMRRGYRAMGHLNLALAEEGPLFESGSARRRGRSQGNRSARPRQAGSP